MKTFLRTVVFVIISLVVGFIVAAGISAATMIPLPRDVSFVSCFIEGTQPPDRASCLLFLIANQQSIGVIHTVFWPVSIGALYLLGRWWQSRGKTASPPSPPGGLVRVIAAIAGGLIASMMVAYGLYTLFVIVPGFPGLEAAPTELDRWALQTGREADARGTISVIVWIAGAVVTWWLTRSDSPLYTTYYRDAGRLIKSLNHSDSTVRAVAAKALADLGDSRAVEPLIVALNDPNLSVQIQAAESLGRLRDPRAAQSLITVLKNGHERMRPKARYALQYIRTPEAMQAIEEHDTQYPDIDSLKANRDVDKLIKALQAQTPGVRVQVVKALAQLGDSRAVDPLIAALKDEVSGVRIQVVEALGQLRDPKAVESLGFLVTDNDVSVRNAALKALKSIGGPEAERILAEHQA